MNRGCESRIVLALLALLVGVGAPARAADSYRYVNDQGNLVLDHTVPPEFLRKGYDVLGADGRLLRRVPPQSELNAQAAAARAQAAAGRASVGSTSDEDLLRMYRSVDEVERARDRKVELLERAVGVERANVLRLKTQKRNFEVHGAELERSGRPVSQELIDGLASVTGQIHDREQMVLARAAEKAQTVNVFEQAVARLRALRGG